VQDASADIVAQFETELDRWFASFLPPQRAVSHQWLWEHLSVTEDGLRIVLSRCVSESTPLLGKFSTHLGRIGEGIRRTFGNISMPNATAHSRPIVASMRKKIYVRNAELNKAAIQYANAYEQFLFYHRGHSVATVSEDGNRLHFRPTAFHYEYHVLDFVESITSPKPKTVHLLIDGLRMAAEFGSPGVPQSAKAVMPSITQMLHDEPNEDMILQFAAQYPEETTLPPSFVIEGMSASEISSVLRAIKLLAIYHVLSVFSVADQLKIRGGLVEACVPIWKRTLLVERLSRLSGVTATVVEKIVSALTFGRNMKNPDPLLQPFFAGNNDTLSVIPVLLAFAEVERNFLALMSKVARREFDAASAVFAINMTDNLEREAQKKGWLVRQEFQVLSMFEVGPIDLIMADPRSRTLLILELRWTLRPGDVHEALDRIGLVDQKVAQVQRKARVVHENQAEVLSALHEVSGGSLWETVSAVIIDGFLGRGSSSPETPVMPERTFLRLLDQSESVAELVCSMRDERWRMVEGVDFMRETNGFTFRGKEIEYEVWGPTTEGYSKHAHPERREGSNTPGDRGTSR